MDTSALRNGPIPVPLIAAVALVWLGCAAPTLAVNANTYPELPGPTLKLGREVWLGTCAVCHTDDFSGAPQVTDLHAWQPRIDKGKEILYTQALKGFFGPKGTQMPARGDNPKLSDQEVKAAVDYMVALVVALNSKAE